MKRIEEREGRSLFGLNPAGYDQVRPPYPDSFFSLLIEQGALFPGAVTLEIGPGNGLATRVLMAQGAHPLTLVEPNRGFERMLNSLSAQVDVDIQLVQAAFEDAVLPPASYDLVVAATAYHWLNPKTRVEKIANLLKPMGYVALLWNVFGTLHKDDPFHEATKTLLAHLSKSPSDSSDTIPFGLDRQNREGEFMHSGKFEVRSYVEIQWTLQLDTAQVGLLYEGFSSIARLPALERTEILDQIMTIAGTQFHGLVNRNMTSVLYLFQRM